ncbi:MAG: protein-disulfide reductase DsbD domain-containing protein [Pseudomonadota bacterium]
MKHCSAFVMAVVATLAIGAVAQEAGAADLKVQADLVAPLTAVQPGKPLQVGLRQRITPKWHTYWKNPGDSGQATQLEWRLPQGWTASDIHWPPPEALPVGPLMNYGYSNTILLPVTLTPPPDITADQVTLTAHATWLVCEEICIPEEKTVSLTLDVARGGTVAASSEAALFSAAERARPIASPWASAISVAETEVTLLVQARDIDPSRIGDVRFFPAEWGIVKPAAEQRATWSDRGLQIVLTRGELAGQPLSKLSGVLVLTERIDGADVRNSFEITASVGAAAVLPAPAVSGQSTPTAGSDIAPSAGTSVSLLQAVLFAFLGGLILNLMPCVLPILSVKALSLTSHGGRTPALAFLGGVLVSFGLLAVVLLGLRATGQVVGWGFQFQSPEFVLALALFFFALALSLSGVFDIGGGIVGVGEAATQQSGPRGAFFTGVLATIAATPCTAPFMGVALGYALTRPAIETVIVLQALGIGFALPLVLLALSDAMRKALPKPGAWMVTLKQVLAFPLYATVGWLVWVLSLQTGSEGILAAAIALVLTGLICWILGRGQWMLRARVGAAAVVALAGLYVIAPRLAVGSVGEAAPERAVHSAAASADAIPSEPFSEARVNELRGAGHAVFVNLTAAWCISCKVNEQVALASDGFRRALDTYNVVYLKGDWTRRDDRITRVLQAHGRAGVPLYLLYPADPSAAPIVLPQLLTEAVVVRHFASMKRPTSAGN